MKKYNYYHILVLITFLFLLIGKVNAVNNLNIPTLSQRVTDLSQILTFNQQQQLEAHLTLLEQQRGDGSQIAILVIPSMQGESVETYANKVFNQWRLGQAGKDNGILLLIALNDRELRIEVGYGLEGVLTDLKSHKIIQQYLVPSFKEQQYYDGILAAVNAINTVIIDPDNAFLDELDIADTIYGQLVFYVACCALATIILFSLVNLLKPTTLKRWLQIYLLMLVEVTLACYLYSQYIGYYQHIGLVKSLSFVTIMYLLLSIMVLFVWVLGS